MSESFPLNADCSENEDAYSWDFGNGGTTIAKSATHMYANPGTYQVALRVDGNEGNETKSQSINIAQVCYTCTCNIPFSSTSCGTIQNAEAWCSGCVAPGYSCDCN
jgi:PKD repeat protein